MTPPTEVASITIWDGLDDEGAQVWGFRLDGMEYVQAAELSRLVADLLHQRLLAMAEEVNLGYEHEPEDDGDEHG